MSQFTKKLQEIKKETFRLNDFYTQELIELFDFQNDEDKNFLLWNNEKSNLYEGDIYNLLKSLLDEKKLEGYEEEIIENYKDKYLKNNSAISQTYCLIYIDLFIDYYKTKDYKTLFRQLYDNSDNDLVKKFTDIFCEIKDEEYFVKSFNIFLWEETTFWKKYFSKINIEFLLGLKDEYFSSFIHNISNEWFIYFKDFDLEYSKILIKRIKWLWNSDINNKLKNQFLEIIDNAFWREGYKHDRYRKTENFIKSHFWKLLNKYIWKIFNDFSLDLFGKLWYLLWYWDIITLISDILSIEYIEEIVKKSWKEFYDVSIFENIEWWTRKDKKKLLEEFKKYKEFNKRLEKRKEILEKNKLKQEERENKEKEKFFSWINKIIDEEKKDSKWINEYLLYHFDENTYKIQEDKEIKKIVRNQVKRFFKLEYSNPEKYELHYTRIDENGSSYRTHQFVVNHTFLRCLKFYQHFWFKINNDIKKKAIRYVPFAYEDDLENIFAFVWNTELGKDDIDYLLSVYDWTRNKDDLKYHNISSFTWFYEKYKDSFIKYWKIETQKTFIKIINDENHKSYERKYIAEKLSEIWEETQLFELFNNYKSEENYFSNIEKLTLAVIFWKSVVKRFPNSKGKTEIINWFIKQLREAKISIPEVDYWEWMRWISWIESELSWDLDKEESFISVFKYINDLTFEKDIKELLNYSFEIIEEPKKDYRIYWNYLQQAVFNFYEGIEKKNLKKIFELEKEISKKVKDDETRILFKVNFLDKLISIYSENVDKWKIHDIYKSVYNHEIPLKEVKNFPLIITEWKTDWRYFLKALDYFHNKWEFLNIESKFFLKYWDKKDYENWICWTEYYLKMGDSELEKYLTNLINVRDKDPFINKTIRIWIFDSDNVKINIVNSKKDLVFSFKIEPNDISTELLFSDDEIKTNIIIENKEKRMYLWNEFNKESKRLIWNSKISIWWNESSCFNKWWYNKVIDRNIYDENDEDISLTKDTFSKLIYEWKIKVSSESWNNFKHIFEKITEIIKDNNL